MPADDTVKVKQRLTLPQKIALHRARTITTNQKQNHVASPRLIPVPESDLLRDILYILRGVDGAWIKFSSPAVVPPGAQRNANVATGSNIVFTPSTTHFISSPTRDLLYELSELGHLLLAIETALQSGKTRAIGMIEQSLHAALKEELLEYSRLITVLEGQLSVGEEEEGEGKLRLRRMLVWTAEVRLKMRMMAVLVGDTAHRPAGSTLLTFLHSYTTNGNAFIRTFSSRLLRTLSVPFFATLSAWIYEGELRDPYGEFFVAVDPTLAGRDEEESDGSEVREGGVRGGELWEGKFIFKRELLPGFLEEEFGRKIYSTGKSLNFMKHSCKDSEWVVTRDRADGLNRTLQYADMAGLEQSTALAYSTASQRLFNTFFDKFRLLDHLKALKNYLMLGKGDFVEILIENLGPSLAKPANILYRHNLTATLEAAIKNSTSASDHPDTLRRLDARMLEFNAGEIGWDVFTLEYKIDSPLDTVLDERSMESYLKMFKYLWQIKRVEFSLNEIYARLMTGARTFLRVPALKHQFHKTRLAVADVRFFITQLQAYCHSEVIECSWRTLEEFVIKKSGDLDSLIEAHRAYLDRLVSKGLLLSPRKTARGGEPVSMLTMVREIFAVALQYREAVDSLCDYALAEAARQEGLRDVHRGITSSNPPPDQATKLYRIESRLSQYYETFQALARDVVVALGQAPDLDMRFLSIRENYNEYYVKPRDPKERAERREKEKARLKADEERGREAVV